MQQAYSMIMKIVKILLSVTVILKLQVERGIGIYNIHVAAGALYIQIASCSLCIQVC